MQPPGSAIDTLFTTEPMRNTRRPIARFRNISGTNYHLEQLIKAARDRLILTSPFLKLNDCMKELLAGNDRLRIDLRIVDGKSDLAPAEIGWLKATMR